MSDSPLDWIWSQYMISPDPASEMQSLHRTCSALIQHVLQPSHIVLSHGGFTLHSDLMDPLINVVPALDRLLNLGWRHHGLSPHSVGHMELEALTCTPELTAPATQSQVVWNWVHVLNEIYIAMEDLKCLYSGCPVYVLGRTRPSRMRSIVVSLPPSLRVKLPTKFLHSYGIMVLPPAANAQRAASQEAAALRKPTWSTQISLDHTEVEGLVNFPTSMPSDGVNGKRQVADAPSSSRSTPATVAVSASCSSSCAVNLQCSSDTMAPLIADYAADSYSSLRSRTTRIISKRSLNEKNITDHGAESSKERFGLQASFFLTVDNTVKEMQSLLTRAASLLPGQGSCFLVDPRGIPFKIFRGSNMVRELDAAWEALVERMEIATERFDDYQQEYNGEVSTPDSRSMAHAVFLPVWSRAASTVAVPSTAQDHEHGNAKSSRVRDSFCISKPPPSALEHSDGLYSLSSVTSKDSSSVTDLPPAREATTPVVIENKSAVDEDLCQGNRPSVRPSVRPAPAHRTALRPCPILRPTPTPRPASPVRPASPERPPSPGTLSSVPPDSIPPHPPSSGRSHWNVLCDQARDHCRSLRTRATG
ncbi:hypothetical protein K438DRAFT_237529 [Mycena galopus ATCC 62051]|nr:hypothetical protein K438DRAFT_237529 [Mycena galopus ATCC 62051]